MMPRIPWIVCQLGAREHYAVPRALHRQGVLDSLVTDLWVSPKHLLANIPLLNRLAGMRRLRGRFDPELAGGRVLASNFRALFHEGIHHLQRHDGTRGLLSRYAVFQAAAVRVLKADLRRASAQRILFSYSNTALKLFRFASTRDWPTVLGQVDPGPEEHRIINEEQQRYPLWETTWKAAPASYWDAWWEEIDLSERIIINSEWSRECLLKVGVPANKLEIIPLVYDGIPPVQRPPRPDGAPLRVLFLGQITLRKGIARLLDAMRLLIDEPIELILAGPTWISPEAWKGLKVRWLGAVPRSEVNAVYDAADVFILPTLSDGYALTQLEALARGVPVIASKNCGSAVVHGRNGWILDDLEPTTIASMLSSLKVSSLTGPITNLQAFGIDELGAALIGLGQPLSPYQRHASGSAM